MVFNIFSIILSSSDSTWVTQIEWLDFCDLKQVTQLESTYFQNRFYTDLCCCALQQQIDRPKVSGNAKSHHITCHDPLCKSRVIPIIKRSIVEVESSNWKSSSSSVKNWINWRNFATQKQHEFFLKNENCVENFEWLS